MTPGLNLLIANIPTVICALASCYMAVNSIEGWGWFLFVAVLLGVYPKSKDDEG